MASASPRKNPSGSTPSLLTIPPEIRQHIFSYVFEDEWLYLSPGSRCFGSSTQQLHRGAVSSVLFVCRQLRAEASMVHFSNLTVSCDVAAQASRSPELLKWLLEIGESNAELLRRFTLRWSNYVDVSIVLALPSAPSPRQHPPLGDPTTCRPAHAILNPSIAKRILQRASGMATTAEYITCTGTHTSKLSQPHLLDMPPQPLSPPNTDISHDDITTSSLPSATVSTSTFSLSISGIPELHLPAYWQHMGTSAFCDMLAKVLAEKLDQYLRDRKRPHLTREEIARVVAEADAHASALMWLWVC